MLNSNLNNPPCPSSDPLPSPENGCSSKRKRRPAGTPDPDAEVVSLSPKTLLESDRYVCEICNQGFQRDQNLQMHRRRHKVPWKLLKRETPVARKRVFVCPEPSCLHHNPCHALGDLVGIKKHFRRKHSNQKQWVCDKCSKGYAVQSDYKAHLKTCGTRGHSCDCGRVFSRVESFIEHQDACCLGRIRSDCRPLQTPPSVCLSRTASSPSPSSDTNISVAPWAAAATSMVAAPPAPARGFPKAPMDHPIFFTNAANSRSPNLELELFTKSTATAKFDADHSTQLQLSIGSSEGGDKSEADNANVLKEQAQEQLRIAVAEKAYSEEARQQSRRQIELAKQEFANAKRIRQQAQAELEKAVALKEHAAKQLSSAVLQITCHSCRNRFQLHAEVPETSSSSLSYISAALREWEIKRTDKTSSS